MAAIITSKTRLNNTKQFLQSFKPEYIEVRSGGGSVYNYIRRNEYYVTIGKSTSWATEPNPVVPEATDMYAFNANEDFIYSKKINYTETSSSFDSNVMHVTQRYDWTTGVVYREFDTNTDMFVNEVSSDWKTTGATKPFYVVTSDDYAYRVYMCVYNNHGADSTQSPQEADDTGNSEGQNASGFNGLIKTSDGYLWKLMYEITSPSILDFVTDDWIPVRTLKYDDGSRQWDIQTSAEGRNNGILFFKVTSPGSGYTVAPASITLTIAPPAHGGTNATQGLSNLVYNGSGGIEGYITTTNVGTNYLYNAVVTHDQTTANSFVLSPFISPINGLGSDPVTQLGAFNLMILTKIKGTDANLISDNEYRKIYVIKNPGRRGTVQTFASVPLSNISSYTALLNITVDNNVVLNSSLPTGFSTMTELRGKKIMFLTGRSKGEIKIIVDAGTISGNNVAVLDSPFTNSDHKVTPSDKYIILVDAESEREMLKVILTTNPSVANDIQVQQAITNATGYVTSTTIEEISSVNRRVLYLTETYKEFNGSDALTNVATSTPVGTVLSTPEKLGIEYYYNELLYAEARQPISRAEDQTENIRIVLQF